jgi:hypothetical protein
MNVLYLLSALFLETLAAAKRRKIVYVLSFLNKGLLFEDLNLSTADSGDPHSWLLEIFFLRQSLYYYNPCFLSPALPMTVCQLVK